MTKNLGILRVWRFGIVHRGVAYWADGRDKRILFGTGDGYLICLIASTGKPPSRVVGLRPTFRTKPD